MPGAVTPKLITRDMLPLMKKGAVLVDVSIDQGGCIETTRPTDYRSPTYQVDGVVHLAVTNLPGAVPRSASQALSAALIPRLLILADGGLAGNSELQHGLNVQAGEVCHPALLSMQETK